MNKKYLMITNFSNHWDNIKRTTYTTSFVSDEVKNHLADHETLFVKIDSSSNKRIIKVWEGRVSNIIQTGNKISFDVIIAREIKEYIALDIDIKQPYWRFYDEVKENVLDYAPPFFEKLLTTKDWRYFEDETFKLLKLLGINNVFKFTNQRGEADGFFKFENLAVIYDTTLEDDFENKKKTQMENFCAQLQMGSILINEQNTIQTFHECQKQVWIITRGSSRIISKHNNILIKEISIVDIMDLYLERLDSQCTTDILENKLRVIG
jgi:hypothetical protein